VMHKVDATFVVLLFEKCISHAHLLFANDFFLFSGACESKAVAMMNILATYEATFGS